MQSPELQSQALRISVQHNGEQMPTPSPDRNMQRHNNNNNNNNPPPHHRNTTARVHYYSSSSVYSNKLRRFNTLILVLRIVCMCFSLAASIFMAMNTHKPGNGDSAPRVPWYDFSAFRFVFAGNAIICIYSFAQVVFVMWELLKGSTLLPEMIQVWFDFSHDQAFAYLLLSASSAGTELAQDLQNGHRWIGSNHTCKDVNVFCVQADIAVSLGFAAFFFLASVGILTGFRVACYIITDSRFQL